jgi:hypothetical protein
LSWRREKGQGRRPDHSCTSPHDSRTICCRCNYSTKTGSLALQLFDIQLGTGTLLLGVCPRLRIGTGTAADGRASPWPPSARRPSRVHVLAMKLLNHAG